MALKGDLVSADLSNVFQMLALNRKAGVLTVQDRSNPVARRRLFINGQTVHLADPISGPPSAALLVESGRLSFDDWVGARRRAAKYGQEPWAALKAQRLITDADEEHWRSRAVTEAVLDVFLWRDIRFSLDESAANPCPPDAVALHVDHLVMEAARRQDEWRNIQERVGTARDVYRRTEVDTDLAENLDPATRIVLEFVDGVRGAAQISGESGLPRYFVDLALAELLERGLIARLELVELMRGADELSSAGRAEESIRLLHCALRIDRQNLTIHKRLAAAYLDAGQQAKGCAHYRFCAGVLLAAGHSREALTVMQLVWRTLPSHFATLETIVKTLVREEGALTKDDRACLNDARKLVAVLQDTGEVERATKLSRTLWRVDPEDRQSLATFARLSVRLGRVDDAVEAYLALASLLREQGEIRQALDVYRTLTTIDAGGNRLYQEQISDLRRQVDVDRQRANRGRAVRTTAVITVVLGLLWGAYAVYGERRLAALNQRAPGEPAAQEVLANEYHGLSIWFALAPAGERAAGKAHTWYELARRQRDVERESATHRAEDRTRRQQAGEEAVAAGHRFLKRGDLPAAIERFHFGLDHAAVTDGQFWDEARRALADAEQYVSTARDLLAQAQRLERSDPAAAFKLRVQLLRDYDLLDDVRAITLTVTIETVPPGAWVVLDDGAQEGLAPLTLTIKGRKPVHLEARAPGCLSRSMTLPSPPAGPLVQVVLERSPAVSLELGEPLVAVVPAGGGRAIVSARNGRLHVVDTRSGTVVIKFAPESIETQRAAPVVSGERVLCRHEDGRCRVLEITGLRVVRNVRFEAPAVVQAEAAPGGGWVLLDGARHFVRLDPDGILAKEYRLPDGITLTGFAVLGDGRVAASSTSGVWLVDLARGTAELVTKDPAVSVVASSERAILIATGNFVLSLDLVSRDVRTVVRCDCPLTNLFRVGAERFLARIAPDEMIVVTEHGAGAHLTLPAPMADVPPFADGSGEHVGLMLESGWCSIFELSSGRYVAAHSADRGAIPAFFGGVLVMPRDLGALTLTTDF